MADEPPESDLGQATDAVVEQSSGQKAGGTVRLLFFFVLMVQLSDALQYAWSKLPSKHLIVPDISLTRTWEGLLGGTASVTLLGTALWFLSGNPEPGGFLG